MAFVVRSRCNVCCSKLFYILKQDTGVAYVNLEVPSGKWLECFKSNIPLLLILLDIEK
jgi:hypothetical protein